MTQLGGEYEAPPGTPFRLSAAQLLFLGEIEQQAPEVLTDLRERVLERPELIPSMDPVTDDDPDLLAWANAWHLSDDWCILAARLQLWHWANPEWAQWWPGAPNDAGNDLSPFGMWRAHAVDEHGGPGLAAAGLTWSLPGEEGYTKSLEAEPVLAYPGPFPRWNPELEKWQKYEADAVATFRVVLKLYRAAAEKWVKERGLVRVARKMKRIDPTRHYEWLVRYQVQDWSHMKIAKHYDVEPPSISEALRKAAKSIGLTLRLTGQPGRPRKKRGRT